MFIHFLHDQLISLYALDRRVRRIRLIQAARGALRLCAFISSDNLIIPTTDLVQSPVVGPLYNDLRELASVDLLYFVGSTIDVGQLQTLKVAHFNDTGFHGQWTQSSIKRRFHSIEPNLRARETNTTNDVKERWSQDVIALTGSSGKVRPSTRQIREARNFLPERPTAPEYEAALVAMPERLEDHAFLWYVIEKLGIFPFDLPPPARGKLEMALAWHWAMSYLEEYETTLAGRILGLGYVDCGVLRTHPQNVIDLIAIHRAMEMLGLGGAFRELTLQEILALRYDPALIFLLKNVIIPLAALLCTTSVATLGGDRPLLQIVDEAKHVSAGASTPREAVIRTARFALDSGFRAATATPFVFVGTGIVQGHPKPAVRSSERSSMSTEITEQRAVRVAAVLALPEELLAIRYLVESAVGRLRVVESTRTGRLAYTTTKTTASGVDVQLVFSLIGKGQERAAAASVFVVAEFEPAVLVNLGIAGAMSDDVSLGDVVVGDHIVSYMANSKAVATASDKFRFALAGEPLRSDEFLTDRMRQLSLVAPTEYAAWVNRAELSDPLTPVKSNKVKRQPSLRVGPIASGPTVVGVASFKDWLKTGKRDYQAVEMESSGVAIAAELTGMLQRVRFLTLRGISDGADERKNELERQSEGAVRRWAMTNTLDLFLVFLDSLSAQMARRLGNVTEL